MHSLTDSSLTGFGAYNAKIDETYKKISNVTITNFMSRPWDIAYSLLSSRHRDLGAIAAALEYFKLYLPRDRPIYCFSDHKALEDIQSDKLSTLAFNRTRKCLAQIIEYPLLQIKYLPDTDIAEKLSRSYVFNDVS